MSATKQLKITAFFGGNSGQSTTRAESKATPGKDKPPITLKSKNKDNETICPAPVVIDLHDDDSEEVLKVDSKIENVEMEDDDSIKRPAKKSLKRLVLLDDDEEEDEPPQNENDCNDVNDGDDERTLEYDLEPAKKVLSSDDEATEISDGAGEDVKVVPGSRSKSYPKTRKTPKRPKVAKVEDGIIGMKVRSPPNASSKSSR